MGAGRPVLYYDTVENSEVVGEAGLRFTFDGRTALENVLTRVVEDPSALAELGLLAQARVAERYTWDRVASAYEELLEGLC
jgi:glycosyltransferase involved in cell wall biosynthesis